MSEQRLKVEPGPPEPMISDAGTGGSPPEQEDPGRAGRVGGRGQEVVGSAKEKAVAVAGEARSHVRAAAGQVKSQAAVQVDERSTLVGRRVGLQGEVLEGVAGELREQGRDGPARIAEQAAERVRNVGGYLEQADGEKLVEAAQKVARDNPAAAAAVGAAAGFAAGRVIKASLGDGADPQAAADQLPTEPGQPGSPEGGG